MNFTDEQLERLTRQAIKAALSAGEVINAQRQSEIEVQHKQSGSSAASQVVTAVDYQAQAAILEILQPSCNEYDLALLTEESPDDGQRLKKAAFWCIDPMDGTLAFINNTPGFAVSIALVARDGTPLIGVVYDPVEQCLYHASHRRGAYRDGAPIRLPEADPGQPLILRTDFSFQHHPWLEQTRRELNDIARQLGLSGADIQFHIGAVMNACRALEIANCCYFKYPRSDNSGGSLWDYAATACLYREAGAIASDIHGRPMDLNRPDSTFMNHRGVLYTCHSAVGEKITRLHLALAPTAPPIK